MSTTATSTKPHFTAGVYVPGQDEDGVFRVVAGETSDNQHQREIPDTLQLQQGQVKNNSCAVSVDSSDAMYETVSDNEAIRREREGLCIKCGTKLYKTKKKGIFKTKEVKIPLNIPGKVERGQCLKCGTSPEDYNVSPCSSFADADDIGIEGVPITGASLARSSLSKNNVVYEGSFNVYGERDGQGTMTWENGDKYTGDFFNGNRHGHGTLLFSDGSEYVGEWECNKQHGVGTRRWNNGDCYTGQYQNGKRTGEGRFYFSNGDMYTGQWDDGVMQGAGRYYYASGQRFEGTFVDGRRKGKGKLQRTDGSLDVGVYSDDVRMGVGVRWSADRTQAWRMLDGHVKKKITIPEAVSLDYDIDGAAAALDEGGVV